MTAISLYRLSHCVCVNVTFVDSSDLAAVHANLPSDASAKRVSQSPNERHVSQPIPRDLREQRP